MIQQIQDPQTGEITYFDDQADQGQPSAPAAPFLQPSLDPTQDQFHGIDYWTGKGYTTGDMFDANGQMNPGWTRTANGYEYTPPVTSTALTPPSTAAGWMPQFNAPRFNAPPAFSFQDFKAPTMADAENEPGYAFAMEQGRKALENSAAGRGVLRTGGTLKDIFAYGNRLGEQNYGNVFSRAKDTYSLNRNNAAENYATNYGVSRDVFDRNYKAALDEYTPLAREAELNHGQDFNTWLQKMLTANNIFASGQD